LFQETCIGDAEYRQDQYYAEGQLSDPKADVVPIALGGLVLG
jgi:hypothetical protein